MRNRKLGVDSAHRKAMLRNLATSLVMHGSITTTHKRALELRTVADKLVTLAKRNDLHARRQAAQILFNVKDDQGQTALQKLFAEIGPKYTTRNGGYTRVNKTVQSRGDASDMAVIEFV